MPAVLGACDSCSTSDSMVLLHGDMVKFNTYRDNLLRRSGAGSMWYLDVASRRAAVGLAGCAPRFVPNRGHSALIPDAFGPAR